MAKYRKKPVVIEAVKITDEFFDSEHPNPNHPIGVLIDPINKCVTVKTLEGEMLGKIGDWIVTGIDPECGKHSWPVKDTYFKENYEKVED